MSKMMVEQNIEIPMRDGAVLRANLYGPGDNDSYPVIITVGPYGKDVHFSEFSPEAYSQIDEQGPYLNWETPNPEWWVPQGYALLRVDQRGIGASPGFLRTLDHQEATDFYDVIEWAAIQPWCTGKVGLLGISYYALTQWEVAALQPPHLTAMIPWEGLLDKYRDAARHGGIVCDGFINFWFPQVTKRQHGTDGSLSAKERAANRVDLLTQVRENVLDDASSRSFTPDTGKIVVPFLSVGNWGGTGLHLRGNVEGYTGSSSPHKWLRIQTGTHFTPFYSEEGRALQARFFDYWLKGHDNGLLCDPLVRLAIRKGTEASWRDEQEWPLARTQWTPFSLDATTQSLAEYAPGSKAQVSYQAPDGGVTFCTRPFAANTEVTGPLSLRVWVSSSAKEMDLFVTIRNVDTQGQDVNCIGTIGDAVPVAKGWLRASHRKLDPERSLPYRPYHSHDELQPLSPGEIAPLDIEIWPTSMVFETGHRLALDLQAHDGVGASLFTHNDPIDRDPARLGGTNTIYTGGSWDSCLLLPIIPNEQSSRT